MEYFSLSLKLGAINTAVTWLLPERNLKNVQLFSTYEGGNE